MYDEANHDSEESQYERATERYRTRLAQEAREPEAELSPVVTPNLDRNRETARAGRLGSAPQRKTA